VQRDLTAVWIDSEFFFLWIQFLQKPEAVLHVSHEFVWSHQPFMLD